MRNNNWLISDLQQRRLFAGKKRLSPLSVQALCVRWLCVVMLLALALLLSACTPLPTRPCEMPPLPTQPALSQPLPSATYSSKVQSDTETWERRVTGTSTTSAP